MHLILKVKNTLHEQFPDGIKVKADRLKDVDRAYVIKHDKIIAVYEIDNTQILYNAQTKSTQLKSIIQNEIKNDEMIGQEIEYNTYNPATINQNIRDIIKS